MPESGHIKNALCCIEQLYDKYQITVKNYRIAASKRSRNQTTEL